MGFKGIWWLNGICGKTNAFEGRVFDYQPIWGTGAGVVGLYPKQPIRSIPDWVNDEADLVERLSGASPKKTPVQTAAASVTPAAGDGTRISAGKAPPPVGPYPHARREGEFLFLSGCGPRKPGTKDIPGVTLDAEGVVIDYDVEVQTRSVMENIQAILEASGCSMDDVIDVQVYLTDMKRDFATFNRVYGEYFGSRKDASGVVIGPCRTTVEVGALPTPIAVELKVLARVKSARV
jgi:2-aminomuconate deaminase